MKQVVIVISHISLNLLSFFCLRDLHETFLQEISPHKMKKEIQQLFWCQEEDKDRSN